MRHCLAPILVSAFLTCTTPLLKAAPQDIPVAYDVDIVVAGGGCGGVAAAVSAARQGASVLLLTSRNYLGEDMAGAMQLWLEPGEAPMTALAKELFSDPFFADNPGLPYTYTTDQASQTRHPDTTPPSRLRRRRPATDPQHDSVQYGDDVAVTADLGVLTVVREIVVSAFIRPHDFAIKDALISISSDRESWRDLGRFPCKTLGGIQHISVPVEEPVHYVRLLVRRATTAKRILLGSIKFLGNDITPPTPGVTVVRPLHAKKTLEQALRSAEVEFLFGCYPSELLVDLGGGASGLVMTNRMGRQAVRAKVVIDATEHAVLARTAGVAFRAPKQAGRTLHWVAISEHARAADGLSTRKLPFPVTVYDLHGREVRETNASWYDYSICTQTPDTLVARMDLEQEIRELTFDPTQLYAADRATIAPLETIVSQERGTGRWTDANSVPLGACRPRNTPRLWVLGGCADLTGAVIERLLRPAHMLQFGERVGEEAAAEASGTVAPGTITVASQTVQGPVCEKTVLESLAGLRPQDLPRTVRDPGSPLPLFGDYDVVVVGGGTSGAAAGIAAARQGARTLVLEVLHGLGGVGTLGMIGKYWYGNRVGFAAEVPENPIEKRLEFYRSELRKAGGDVWFGVLGCGATVQGNRVTGVVVATPFGRGIVTADVVIDGTGNADIAAVAGAKTEFVDAFFALQMSHIPPREIGASYINGNQTPVDAADPLDVTAAMTAFPNRSFDRGQIIASRERRRIVGDYRLDWLDQLNRRTFPDSITFAKSDYDSHGYQVHPYFMLRPARVPDDHRRQFTSYVPYRCLLPQGLEGILVVGLAVSAHRDAIPIVRMQPDLQNIGYAAGVAAAMAAQEQKPLRKIDIDTLQAILVKAGNLAADVPDHTDSYPPTEQALEQAVGKLPDSYDGLGLVLAAPARSRPLLRAAYDQAEGAERLAYAHVLGILRDPHGVEALLAEAWRLLDKKDSAYRKESDGMDRVNQLLWALGRTGDPSVVSILCRLANAGFVNTSGRFRALVVSLGDVAGPSSAATLAKLLKEKEGTGSVPEIMAACALRQCGDRDGAAKRVLERFSKGNNGPFARLAQQALAK